MKYEITRDLVAFLIIENDWTCPEQESNPDGCEDCETITHPDLPGVVIKNNSSEMEGPEALQNLLKMVYEQAYSAGAIRESLNN